jgi:hypothetical protein
LGENNNNDKEDTNETQTIDTKRKVIGIFEAMDFEDYSKSFDCETPQSDRGNTG